jgi:hypothetical protein
MADRSYSIGEDVLAAHLEGEAVLLDFATKRYYRLNATGAFIWKALEQQLEPAAIVDSLVEQFDVDAATARPEVTRLLAELHAQGLLA